MSEEQLLTTLGVKDKGTGTQIKALKNELKYLDNQYKTTVNGSKTFEKSTEGLKTKIDYLGKRIEATKTKLQVYKNQLFQAQEGATKKREELTKLNEAEGDNSVAIEKTTKQLEKYEQQILQANRNINLTRAELKNLEGELQATNNALNNNSIINYQAKMQALSTQLENASSKLKNMGSVLDNTGSKVLAIASPLVAFGTYSAKTGIEFEKAMDTVQATSQASESDIIKLTEKAKEMGANTSKSATDAAEGLNYMALAGWKTQEMLDGIEPILKASVAYNADLGTTSDLCTDSLSSLGLSAKDLGHYMDIVSSAQSNANTTGTALMESYIGVGGTFKNLNTSLEESSTLLGVMANRGIKGSEAGTTLNSILINLTKKSGESAEAMEELGMSAFDSEGKFRGITPVLRELNEKFAGMTEEQQTMYKSMLAGKTQITGFNALLSGVAEEYDTLYQKQSNCNGALEKMYETMSDNTQGKIDAFKSKLEALGIQFADNLLPHINAFLDKAMELVDWFGGLSKETQQSIVKFTAYSLGVGVALKATGKLTSGIGTLVGGGAKLVSFMGNLASKSTAVGGVLAKLAGIFGTVGGAVIPVVGAVGAVGTAIYGVTQYAKALSHTSKESAEDMSLLERTFVKLEGGTVKSRKELEKLGLVQKELGDNLSKNFKEAVNKATEEVQSFKFELEKVKIDGVVTKEECEGLSARVNSLCDNAISTIDNRTEEIQDKLNKAFSTDGVLDEDEQRIMQYYANSGAKNKEEVAKMQGEINELLRKVRDEGYVLTAEDETKINRYYAEIQRIELEFQASNNQEILFEKNKFLNRANSLDLESAEKMLKERRKYYDEERAEKLAQYDTVIQDLEAQLNNMEGEDRASAERKIASLKAEKQQQSELLNKYYNDEYDALIKQNKNLEGELNRYTGEAMGTEDQACKRRFELMKSHYENINSVTESGLTRLYNNQSKTWEDVYVKIDETTGDIIGITNYWRDQEGLHADQVTGYCESIKGSMDSLSQTAQNDYNYINRALIDSKNTHINTSNEIINSDGKVVGSLSQVKTAADGTRTGIINLNGTPVNIRVNKDGTIANANEINNALNNAARDRTSTITTFVKYKGDGYFSDGRGNVWIDGKKVSSNGYASGTKNATKGVHLVGEEGPELVYFNGGETVLNALDTSKLLTSGGYFNPGTMESNELVNNYNNSYSNLSTTNNYNNNIDINSLANAIAGAVANAIKGMSINMDTQKVASIIDKTNGNVGAMRRRLNGC